jgi:hypothetical protein
MPGLLRGVARTAAIAGTASAVGGRVRHRQEKRWAAEEEPAPAEQPAAPAPAPAQPASGASMLEQLKQLGELKDQGVLTEQEFSEQKAKLLAG